MFFSLGTCEKVLFVMSLTLREKYPYSELFRSVFSPDAGKYGPDSSEYGHFYVVFSVTKLNLFIQLFYLFQDTTM